MSMRLEEVCIRRPNIHGYIYKKIETNYIIYSLDLSFQIF